jgi:chemotaxis protein MotA
MRALLGATLLLATLALTWALTGSGYVGLFNAPALVLVAVAPWCTALISHELAEIGSYLTLAKRAMCFREGTARQALVESLDRLSRAMASGRALASVQAMEETDSDLAHLAGLLLLKQYDSRGINDVFSARTHATLSQVKRAEEFFLSLSRLTPSFGLIGTILGFTLLLQHLSQSDRLGPGMAMALTATLYGISASYCLYHPVARALATHGRKLGEHHALAANAARLLHDGHSLTDLGIARVQPRSEVTPPRLTAPGEVG